MTKQRKPSIPPTFNPSAFEQPTPEPLAADAVNQFVAQITDQPIKRESGRPFKAESAGRVKYSTAIKKEILRNLKQEALDREMTVADLLEKILGNYFKA